jgi:tripartite-type tricarboxylate transporter receptor subunit TctC
MKRLLPVLLAALMSATALSAFAQAYPIKPLRIVVGFPPGGPADALGRVLAQGLSESLGQAAVVENKTGAAGNIGTDAVAKAAPDGYTLGVIPAGNIAVNPALYPNLPYKASELAAVSMLATVENVLVINPNVPAQNLKDLIDLATQKPDTMSFASPGAGSQAHLAGELLALSANVRLLHVPYKGTGPALTDLLGGQVTMMFAQLSSALPHIKSGKLRAIGVASLKRSALLPDVPTVAEQGMARFEAVSWYALMVPANTPREIIERLSSETARLLARSELKEKLSAGGLDVVGGKPQELAATIQSESARWADVIKRRNIKPE